MQSRLNWKKDLSGIAAFDTRGKRETCGVERAYNGKCPWMCKVWHIVKVVALIQLTYLPACFVFVKNEFVCLCHTDNRKDSRST